MSALTQPPAPAAAKRANTGKPLRFHWSLSQAGNTFRRATRAEDLSGQLSFEAQLELCQCAEEHSFDSLLIATGFTHPDPILLSTCLGLKTRHVKFMVACQPGLISPAAFVQQINTLALFVEGRVHINIVDSYPPRELQYHGDSLPRAEHHARLDEFVTACRAFWDADGQEINFAGRYYQITHGRLPTPFSMNDVRRPEIYLEGKSEESAALAIRHADCLWRSAEPPESLAEKIAPVVQTGTEVGLLMSTGPGLGAPATAPRGSAEEMAGALLQYKEIGVTQFLFTGWPDLDEMTFFGREVLPRVRERETAELKR